MEGDHDVSLQAQKSRSHTARFKQSFQSAQEEKLPLAFLLSASGWLKGIAEYFSSEKNASAEDKI